MLSVCKATKAESLEALQHQPRTGMESGAHTKVTLAF